MIKYGLIRAIIRQNLKKLRVSGLYVTDYTFSSKSLAFQMNENWITSHWQLEAHDLEILDYPQENILDKGGYIFVATYKGEPVGVCSLCKMNDSIYDYELAKLAVTPNIQGKGIGRFLCEAVINQAKELGATKIFLESNTLLKPAINLYRKLGFKEVAEYHPLYARGDIQMELTIK